MQVTGKLIELLPLQSGERKNGAWKKREIILETPGTYPKKICVILWNDKAESAFLRVGNTLIVDVDVESRLYNGKWYTELKGWRITMSSGELGPDPQAEKKLFVEKDILPF